MTALRSTAFVGETTSSPAKIVDHRAQQQASSARCAL
jgi:hypothetical protein